MKQRSKGFTLIELMIVVAVIGIISAIAYPAYQDQVRKTRRADAEGVLMSLSNTMERYFTQNNTFVGATSSGNIANYDIVVSSQTATAYTLQAKPKNAQTGDGCLELLSVGTRNRYANDDCSGDVSTW